MIYSEADIQGVIALGGNIKFNIGQPFAHVAGKRLKSESVDFHRGYDSVKKDKLQKQSIKENVN
jgi:hypothetical protein